MMGRLSSAIARTGANNCFQHRCLHSDALCCTLGWHGTSAIALQEWQELIVCSCCVLHQDDGKQAPCMSCTSEGILSYQPHVCLPDGLSELCDASQHKAVERAQGGGQLWHVVHADVHQLNLQNRQKH